jgi:hypothetical protein
LENAGITSLLVVRTARSELAEVLCAPVKAISAQADSDYLADVHEQYFIITNSSRQALK